MTELKKLQQYSLEENLKMFWESGYISRMFCATPYLSKKKQWHSFYIHENYDDSNNLRKERKLAIKIFNDFQKFILARLSQQEKDLFAVFNTFGDDFFFSDCDRASREKSTFINYLARNKNIITIPTDFGNLDFEFATRQSYGVSTNTLMGYEDELNRIVIFVNDINSISILELMTILRQRDYFIHELTHYIDNVTNGKLNRVNANNRTEYLDDEDEQKAFLQAMIASFGAWLFKNQKDLQNYNFFDKKDVLSLFENKFLKGKLQKVIDTKSLELFNDFYNYISDTVRNKIKIQILNCIVKEHSDSSFTESKKRQNLIRLLRLSYTTLLDDISN